MIKVMDDEMLSLYLYEVSLKVEDRYSIYEDRYDEYKTYIAANDFDNVLDGAIKIVSEDINEPIDKSDLLEVYIKCDGRVIISEKELIELSKEL